MDRFQKLLQRTMASLESPVERLVFLSSIRDAYTGRYLHEGWAQVASAEDVHQTAHRMHRASFTSVLDLSLPELMEELRRHFSKLGGKQQEMAGLWLETEPFREMLPAGCSVMEREFFVSQTRLALTALAAAPTSGVPQEPDASPRQLPGPQPPHRRDV